MFPTIQTDMRNPDLFPKSVIIAYLGDYFIQKVKRISLKKSDLNIFIKIKDSKIFLKRQKKIIKLKKS